MPVTYLAFIVVRSDWGELQVNHPGASISLVGGLGQLLDRNVVRYGIANYVFDWQVVPFEITFFQPVSNVTIFTSKGGDGKAKGDEQGSITLYIGNQVFENKEVIFDGVNKKMFDVNLADANYPRST